ncbi:carbohydrate ABC transporter permease [Streptomyces sp. NBC_01803]|uniref:carbohydrate ABC transporter permease n=1 Tax=Streptomyces sp. NBC_01803 TaxID=2975946 RepID=UPI002DDC619B|nr:carbohydrate ABC transporter permease [Streptomyces sp. NBC_01803]WSA43662.1 carbohydrate ABC transporter permease [Streptomyces sp. NBC_01803]
MTATTLLPRRGPRPASRRPVSHANATRARLLSRVLVVLVLLLQVYPFFWIVSTSLRPAESFASDNAFAPPTDVTLDNFSRAFEQGDIPRFLLNSAIVTVASNVLIVVLGMMGAYAIQVLGFRLSRAVLAFFLGGIVVPVQVALVPLFINYANIGLLDTHLSMILPLAGFALPMSVFLFISFYGYVPKETYEAAALDGCGPYRLFLRITAPMSASTIVTVVFVNSIFIWNDFIFANTFILSEERKTVPLGLQSYLGAMGSTDWTATFAAVSVTVTPLLLAFLVFNRIVVRGLESGGRS